MQRAPKSGKKYRILEKRYHFEESRPEVFSYEATFIEKIHYLVSCYSMQNCGIQLIMLPITGKHVSFLVKFIVAPFFFEHIPHTPLRKPSTIRKPCGRGFIDLKCCTASIA
jgi:hypothetical protein